jgi:hypothetical protein
VGFLGGLHRVSDLGSGWRLDRHNLDRDPEI